MRKLPFVFFLLIVLLSTTGKRTSGNSVKENINIEQQGSPENSDISRGYSPSRVYHRLGIGINTDRIFSRDKNGRLIVNYPKGDFEKIANAGFKHIRMTIRVPLMNELKPDSISTQDLQTIFEVVDEILANDLILVFNPVHPSKEFKKRLEDEPDLQKAFIAFWDALSSHLSQYDPSKFLVEPCNEPHFVQAEKWYLLQEQLISVIRKNLPATTIIVAPVTEAITAVTKMKPLADKNLLYAFHFYQPFELTHQGASWTWKFFPAGYKYPNETWNRLKMKKEFFDPIREWAKKNDIQLYGGEFGVIKNADRESRIQWMKDTAGLMKKNKFSGAVWEFKSGDFSILQSSDQTSDLMDFDKEFLRVLNL